MKGNTLELIQACRAYLKAHHFNLLQMIPEWDAWGGYEWQKRGTQYFGGYPCKYPCPNCGENVIWYIRWTWRGTGPHGVDNIEDGYHCERCTHTWSPYTGESWQQGMPDWRKGWQ